jgi:hypothetical protein
MSDSKGQYGRTVSDSFDFRSDGLSSGKSKVFEIQHLHHLHTPIFIYFKICNF